MDVWVFDPHKRDFPENVFLGVRTITYEGHEDCYFLTLYNKTEPIKIDGSKLLELKA